MLRNGLTAWRRTRLVARRAAAATGGPCSAVRAPSGVLHLRQPRLHVTPTACGARMWPQRPHSTSARCDSTRYPRVGAGYCKNAALGARIRRVCTGHRRRHACQRSVSSSSASVRAAADRDTVAGLRGRVTQVVFYAPDTGYVVAKVEVQDLAEGSATGDLSALGLSAGETLTVQGKGGLAAFSAGEVVELDGRLATHPKYGRQLVVARSTACVPQSADAVEMYLGGGAFKGIGPAIAKRIVKQFGAGALDMMHDGRWAEFTRVKGVSKRVVANMQEAWQRTKTVKDLVMFCQEHKLPPSLAERLTAVYGASALDVLKSDPYRMVMDVRGVGFNTADDIARRLVGSSDPVAPARLLAAVVHVVQSCAADGHCCMGEDEVVRQAAELLFKSPRGGRQTDAAKEAAAARIASVQPAVRGQLQVAVEAGKLVHERLVVPGGEAGEAADEVSDLYFLPYLHRAETMVSKRVNELMHPAPAGEEEPLPLDWEPVVQQVLREGGDDDLNSQQIHAVRMAMASPLSVVTGGPGTGKTFATRAIVNAWQRLGLRVKIACPTARAARRLNGMLGLSAASSASATTIHRLLEYTPFGRKRGDNAVEGAGDAGADVLGGYGQGQGQQGGDTGRKFRSPFGKNAEQPLEADALLVDEASMLDVQMASALLQAVRNPGGDPERRPVRVLFVGDVDQLPSVGPGAVLADLLNSGVVPSTRLTEVFRQAAQSSVVKNAHLVNQGRMPSHLVDLPLLPITFDDGIAFDDGITFDPPHPAQPTASAAGVGGRGASTAASVTTSAASAAAGAQAAMGFMFPGAAMQPVAVASSAAAAPPAPARPPPPATPPPARPPTPRSEAVGGDPVVKAWRARLRHVVAGVDAGQECLWVPMAGPEHGAEVVAREAVAAVRELGLDPMTQMQVLAPMHRGPLGTDALNKELQALLNPVPRGVRYNAAAGPFRTGDRVMQMVNNYDENVVNGDIGYVSVSSGGAVTVEFDDPAMELAVAAHGDQQPLLPYERAAESTGQVVKYTPAEARRQLRLSYAVTVHKAQGNEWPAVIVVAHQSHYVMLTRGLLYTALSRAQRMCIIVGTRQALGISIKQTRDRFRGTSLAPRIADDYDARLAAFPDTATALDATEVTADPATHPHVQRAYRVAGNGAGDRRDAADWPWELPRNAVDTWPQSYEASLWQAFGLEEALAGDGAVVPHPTPGLDALMEDMPPPDPAAWSSDAEV